ncbi:MAG TPA: 4'-phosphopantetheinyl transferase superfamily protein [Pseudonocardia sp.]|uniref:4'-phosphopantetheinyl transferase family protein n=1 Tax=Pseudonocardia sp. TaxID=60912 RepID=UPI002CEC5438|nr:4'-phosphopantetheinyl transferase superfamily protein [Pseudonocardia sp.]HTF48232.1 4'-phosphopantetheinyl transferase superfamily protein [Pseudonocardia sp.]
MIEKLLPAGVACAEAFTDVAESLMYPEEAAEVAKAVEKRRREFGTARHCARRAMAELGVAPAPVLPGERREPIWPAGVVGSMTHCAGYRAAALALAEGMHSIGIDAEPHAPLPDGVLGAIARDEELPRLAKLAAAEPSVHWDRMLFCAKESVYKAWFPLARRWLGFEEASVTLESTGDFHAELLVPGPRVDGVELRGFTGRWLVEADLLITAICLPVARRPA